MKPNPIYLPIDSSNKDYQFIHIDISEAYGIACKFLFVGNFFIITHMKRINMEDPFNEECIIIENTSNDHFLKDEEVDYKYRLEISLTNAIGKEDNDFKIINNSNGHNYEKKEISDPKPKKNNLIDLKILNAKDNSDKVRFGTQFCRFYIV